MEASFKMHSYIRTEIGHGEVLDEVTELCALRCDCFLHIKFMDYLLLQLLNMNLATVEN